MRFFISVFSFLFIIFTLGCATVQHEYDSNLSCENTNERSPSSALCEDLFRKKSSNKAKEVIDETAHQIVSKLKLASELLPASTTDAFWDTVVQLSENNDSKINLSTSDFILTKNFDNKIKIHSSYTYDTPSNNFIISKIEYSTPEKKNILLSDSPINHETQKLKSDLFIDIYTSKGLKNKLSITEKVHYDVYKKILDESNNLNVFTAHEINNLYKLNPSVRTIKYNSIAKSRLFKKYIVDNIIQDYLLSPLKTITISIASVMIFSHTDFVKNITGQSNETPQWVAPSIVKMSTVYPEKIQPELISLMKNISYQEKQVKIEDLTELDKTQKNVKIDESDQFSIKFNAKDKKTYFFITHEKDNGQLEVYATEINPNQYPKLISYFKSN